MLFEPEELIVVTLFDRLANLRHHLPTWLHEWVEIVIPVLQILLIIGVAWLLQRMLKRLVQREVVDAIAAAIIDGTVREGDQVTVDVDKDGGFTVVCDNTPSATYEVPDAE